MGVRDTMSATLTYSLEVDTNLMLQVKQGDIDSLELLLSKHRKRLIHWLYRMVQDRAIAEELAQEVFLRVYLSREKYEPTAKFTTWLYRIANNRALNWIRDHAQENLHESLDAVPLRGVKRQLSSTLASADAMLVEREIDTDFQRQVRLAIQSLPERQRAAVLMHKYAGLEYTQIAEALGCSVTTVKSVLWRAYTTLRSRLAPLARKRGHVIAA
jgi:RNA polymerase sigma-70 factor, ECF subfamily